MSRELPPLRDGIPANAREAMADVKAAVEDLDALVHLPDLPEEAMRLAAAAAIRMTGATMRLLNDLELWDLL